MEGVGARFGRSSTRHGVTSTVFSGPVRKWKKKWVHVAPSKYHHPDNNNNNNNNHHNNNNHNSNNNSTATGSNGNNNLLFFKWAPIHNIANGDIINNSNRININNNKDEDDDQDNHALDPAPKRKFRYIPVALLEEQQNEAAENEAEEQGEDEVKLNDANSDTAEPTSKNEVLDDKPDINDVPMVENQDAEEAPSTRQDLNKNLSFNLNANDDDPESDTNVDED